MHFAAALLATSLLPCGLAQTHRLCARGTSSESGSSSLEYGSEEGAPPGWEEGVELAPTELDGVFGETPLYETSLKDLFSAAPRKGKATPAKKDKKKERAKQKSKAKTVRSKKSRQGKPSRRQEKATVTKKAAKPVAKQTKPRPKSLEERLADEVAAQERFARSPTGLPQRIVAGVMEKRQRGKGRDVPGSTTLTPVMVQRRGNEAILHGGAAFQDLDDGESVFSRKPSNLPRPRVV